MALTRLQPAALQPSSFSGLNITDGSLYPVDLSTGAPQWTTGGSLTIGNATASTWDSNAKTIEFPQGALMGYGTTSMNLYQNAYLNASTINTYKQSSIASGSYAIASGNHTWRYAAAGTAGNPITWNVGMTLLNTGKVGIGEPSPTQAALEVAPTTMGATGISVKSFAGDTNGLKLSMDAAGVGYINAGYNVSTLMLQTAGSSRLGISNNGDLTFYGRGVSGVNAYIRTFTTSDWVANGQSFELPIHTIMGRDLRMSSFLVMWGGTNYKTGGNHHHGGIARITAGYGNCTVTIDSTSIAGYTITGRTATVSGGYQQAWITVSGATGTDTGSTFTGMLICGGGQF